MTSAAHRLRIIGLPGRYLQRLTPVATNDIEFCMFLCHRYKCTFSRLGLWHVCTMRQMGGEGGNKNSVPSIHNNSLPPADSEAQHGASRM
jgi:hypothetical protein